MKNEQFNCVNQFYESERAGYFGNLDEVKAILSVRSPREQKRIGGQLRYYDDQEWNKVADSVMEEGLRQKFLQNAELKDFLLMTENATIGECNVFDMYWGTGVDLEHATTMQWKGCNRMGELLMKVREQMKKQ